MYTAHASTGQPVSLAPMPPLRHLKAWRESRILTQRELGKLAGINWMTVHNIEHGQDARPSTVRKLAAALGVQPTDLLHPPPANE